MKHEQEITEADQRDLDLAASMVKDGRALRQRVLARIRARVWRRSNRNGALDWSKMVMTNPPAIEEMEK